jgi:hypothetical protein
VKQCFVLSSRDSHPTPLVHSKTNSVRMMTNIYSPRPNYSLFDRCDTLSFLRRFVCLTDVIPFHFGEDLFVWPMWYLVILEKICLFDRCDTLSFWRRFVCLTDVIPCHVGEDFIRLYYLYLIHFVYLIGKYNMFKLPWHVRLS